MLVRIEGTKDTHQFDGFLSQWRSLSLGSDNALENLQELWIFKVGLDDIAGVAGQLSQGVQSGFSLRVGALVLQRINDERHQAVLVWQHVLAAHSCKLTNRLENGGRH